MTIYQVLPLIVIAFLCGATLGTWFEGKWWKLQFDRIKKITELNKPTETNRLSVGGVDALNKHLENCNWRN